MSATMPEIDEPETAAPDHPAPSRGRLIMLAPWLLTIALTIASSVMFVQWRTLQQAEQDRAAVASTSIQVLQLLSTWDAASLDDTREQLGGLATGSFATQIDDLFGGALGTDLSGVGSASSGTVEDVFVQSVAGDTAEAFGVSTQVVTTTSPTTTTSVVSRVKISLLRIDGRWRVVEVAVVQQDKSSSDEAS